MEVFVLALGWGGVLIEQPRLSEKEGLHLHRVVAVFTDVLWVDGGCPKFKGIGVFAKTKSTRQRDEESALPVVGGLCKPTLNALRLLLQSFPRQRIEPTMDVEGRNVRNDFVARRILRFLLERLKGRTEGVGDGQLQLWWSIAHGISRPSV